MSYVSLWAIIFIAMSAVNAVGDFHEGHTIPFWEQACRENRTNACLNLASIHSRYCANGSGWSCNELGILVAEKRFEGSPPPAVFFDRSCSNGFAPGCENHRILGSQRSDFRHAEPQLEDYPLILQQGKGPLSDTTPFQVFSRGCDQKWMGACGSLARFYFQGLGVPQDKQRAISLLEMACAGGHLPSCTNVGLMYKLGDGVQQDRTRAVLLLEKACDGGHALGCTNMGLIYNKGEGVAADSGKASVYFKKACDLGGQEACQLMARAPGR